MKLSIESNCNVLPQNDYFCISSIEITKNNKTHFFDVDSTEIYQKGNSLVSNINHEDITEELLTDANILLNVQTTEDCMFGKHNINKVYFYLGYKVFSNFAEIELENI